MKFGFPSVYIRTYIPPLPALLYFSCQYNAMRACWTLGNGDWKRAWEEEGGRGRKRKKRRSRRACCSTLGFFGSLPLSLPLSLFHTWMDCGTKSRGGGLYECCRAYPTGLLCTCLAERIGGKGRGRGDQASPEPFGEWGVLA